MFFKKELIKVQDAGYSHVPRDEAVSKKISLSEQRTLGIWERKENLWPLEEESSNSDY